MSPSFLKKLLKKSEPGNPASEVNSTSGSAVTRQAPPNPRNVSSPSSIQQSHPVKEQTADDNAQVAETFLSLKLWEEAAKQIPEKEEKLLRSKVNISKLGELVSMRKAIMKTAEDKKRLCEEKRWNIPGFDAALDWLGKVKHVVDVAVSADPLNAALPWAGIKLMLEVCKEVYPLVSSSNALVDDGIKSKANRNAVFRTQSCFVHSPPVLNL